MAGIHKAARAAGINDMQAKSMFAAILSSVADGEPVMVKDFGTFRLKHAAARYITSPQIPGGKMDIPARVMLKFQPAPYVKRFLNGGVAEGEVTEGEENEEEEAVVETEAAAEVTKPEKVTKPTSPAKATAPAKNAVKLAAAKKAPTKE